jgi:hypothetical protein
MASAPFSTAARAHSQSPAGARSSGRTRVGGAGGAADSIGAVLTIWQVFYHDNPTLQAPLRGAARGGGGKFEGSRRAPMLTDVSRWALNRCRVTSLHRVNGCHIEGNPVIFRGWFWLVPLGFPPPPRLGRMKWRTSQAFFEDFRVGLGLGAGGCHLEFGSGNWGIILFQRLHLVTGGYISRELEGFGGGPTSDK